MPRAAPMLSAFNAGELSPFVEGRVDIGKYPNGCKVMEQFIPMIQGPAKRRAGTRFVAEVKDSTARTWLLRFEFNVTQGYQLEFGHQYIRFYTLHGQVVSGGPAYEIASPWTTADLTNSDGTFALRFTESADVVYICHMSYAPRKLSRLAPTSWTLATLSPTNGPFKIINTTATTVYSSGTTGAVTVTASAALFTAAMVGSLFYIAQKSILDIKLWEPGKVIAIGDRRRSSGANYIALTAATTGGNKPVHTSGAVYDGDAGVQWAYEDPGYGYGTITGFTSSTVVSMTVVRQIPFYATLVANASVNWASAAWSDAEGWPSQVNFYKERLVFGRGQSVWLSVSGDYENFADKDGSGTVTADMAISITLQSDKVNNLQWFSSGDSLLCGTAGGEFAVQSITSNLPFGPDNVTAPLVSSFGSRNTIPVKIGEATLFIQRSGLKLRDIIYDSNSGKFQSNDQTIMADHIALSGINQIAFQQEPYSLIWAVRSDGRLVCMTYSREQYDSPPFGGWHNHPISGSFNGGPAVVESVSVIPSPATDRDEVWVIVKRTINGATKRYVEYIEYDRRINDDPQDSFYVDSGLTLDNTKAATLTPGAGATVAGTTGVVFTAGVAIFGAGDVNKEIQVRYFVWNADGKTKNWASSRAKITAFTDTTHVTCTILQEFQSLSAIASLGWRMTVTTITGLGHQEGATVAINGDGATYPSAVVTGGQVTVSPGICKAQIGLPIRARLQTERVNAGGGDGTTQGKNARINKLVLRLHETLGGTVGQSFDQMDSINFRTVADAMDGPPALFTGDIDAVDFEAGYSTDPWVCYENSEPQPATIVGVMPVISGYDRS